MAQSGMATEVMCGTDPQFFAVPNGSHGLPVVCHTDMNHPQDSNVFRWYVTTIPVMGVAELLEPPKKYWGNQRLFQGNFFMRLG